MMLKVQFVWNMIFESHLLNTDTFGTNNPKASLIELGILI